jgi:hypothetical protein
MDYIGPQVQKRVCPEQSAQDPAASPRPHSNQMKCDQADKGPSIAEIQFEGDRLLQATRLNLKVNHQDVFPISEEQRFVRAGQQPHSDGAAGTQVRVLAVGPVTSHTGHRAPPSSGANEN